MKTRIIIAILMLYSAISYGQAQTGGAINGKSKTGTRHEVSIDSTSPNRFPLMVKDSTMVALFGAKDSTKDRKWISVDNFPTTYAATQSGTWNITNVSGTVSLPTGAATESTLTGVYTELTDQSINYLQPSKLKLDSIYTRLGSGVTVNSHAVTNAGTFAVQNTPSASDSTKYRGTVQISNTVPITVASIPSHPVTNAGTFAVQVDSSTQRKGVVIIGGSITAVAGATSTFDSTWSVVNMDTAGLAARASSATAGWQSDSVGLRQWKATDVEIGIRLSMANTVPGSDKAVYVYVAPWWYNGSTWYSASGGTTTQLSGANSAYTIATPNNLRLIGVLSYTTQNMVLQDVFTLSSIFPRMPDAFSIVIVNFSGAAIHTSGNEITYNLMNKTQR